MPGTLAWLGKGLEARMGQDEQKPLAAALLGLGEIHAHLPFLLPGTLQRAEC